MGIGTIFHVGAAAFHLAYGNIPMALIEGGSALKSYAIGELLSPITEPLKEYFFESVEATCDPDVVDSLPFL